MSDIECSNSMFKFKTNCKRLGVPMLKRNHLNNDLNFLIHALPEQTIAKM
jgi:hypothetical protein